MSSNKNIIEDGRIEYTDIGIVNFERIYEIVKDYYDFFDNKSTNTGKFYKNGKNNRKFVITQLQDTNNSRIEPENKRIQSSYINKAIKEKADLIGVYPIHISNQEDKYCYVVWEYKTIKDIVNMKNPCVKVKLYDIYEAAYGYPSKELKKGKRIKYESISYSQNDFIKYYIQLNKQKISNYNFELYLKNNSQSLKGFALQEEINKIVRGNKLQKTFKDSLLKIYNSKCALCQIDHKSLLRGSHIIPVKKILKDNINDMEKKQKIADPKNGLLLCCQHDALFDQHLISFDDKGKIFISKSIDEKLYQSLNINPNIQICKDLYNEKYMKEHFKEAKCKEKKANKQ